MRHSKPLAALGAAAFEHQATLLCGHSDQETMGLLAAPTVRLERAFALHDGGNL